MRIIALISILITLSLAGISQHVNVTNAQINVGSGARFNLSGVNTNIESNGNSIITNNGILENYSGGITTNDNSQIVNPGHIGIIGSASLNGSSSIDNDGTFHLQGNWENNVSQDVLINRNGTGTVGFMGGSKQLVTGAFETNFENLTIQNTGGDTAVYLLRNMIIENSPLFNDGIVVTGSRFFISYGLANDNPSSFVFGNYRQYILGLGLFKLPIGNGLSSTYFRYASLNINSLTPGGFTYIDATFVPLALGGNFSLIEEGTPYTQVNSTGEWKFSPNATPSSIDFELRTFVHPAVFPGLVQNKYALLHRGLNSSDAADWDCSPCGISNSPADGISPAGGIGRVIPWAERRGLTQFGKFGIGQTDCVIGETPEQYNVSINTNDTLYCSDQTGVTVSLSGSETGMTYSLYDGGTFISNIGGTGSAVNFNLHNINANAQLRVLANSGTSQCTMPIPMLDTIEITYFSTVDPNHIYSISKNVADTIYCNAEAATITIASSTMGTNYYLRDDADDSVIEGPIAGTGSTLNFTPYLVTADITFNVQAISSNCNFEMANTVSVVAKVSEIPLDLTPICLNSESSYTIPSSDLGVNYTLRYDYDSSVIDGPIAGNGGAIAFDISSINSDATAHIFVQSPNCTKILMQKPKFLFIDTTIIVSSADTLIACQGSVKVDLSSSESNFIYDLRLHGDSTVISTTAGTGSAMSITGNSVSVPNQLHVNATHSDNGYNLDLSGSIVYLSNTSPINLTSGTIEGWMKTPDAGIGSRVLFARTNGYGLYLRNNELVGMLQVQPGDMNTGVYLNDDKWHHVAMTFQFGVASGTKIYVDGTLVGTYTWNSGAGGTWLNVGEFYGTIDEFRLWNTVRTQEEIRTNMMNDLPKSEPNLIVYYPFINGSGNSVENVTKKTPDATITGGGSYVWQNTSNCSVNLSPTLTIQNKPIEDKVVTAITPIVCTADANITVENSQIGVSYYLRDDANDAIVDGPIAGNGTDILLVDLGLLNSKTYNVFASNSCGNFELTTKPTVIIQLTDLTVTAESPIVCEDTAYITVENSQQNVTYYLRDDSDDSVIDGPISGTGNDIVLSEAVINTNKTYNVLATTSNQLDGAALVFSGGQRGDCGNPSKYHILNGTLELWLKTAYSGSGYRGLITKPNSFALYMKNNELVCHQYGVGDLSTGVYLNDNQWHHVAMSFQDGVPNGTIIYVDGQSVGTFTWNALNPTSHNLCFGGSIAHGHFFVGTLDDIRIWNTVRTPVQIAAYKNDTLTGGEAGLAGYFSLDQGVGNVVQDEAPSPQNAILQNFNPSMWVTPGATGSPMCGEIELSTKPSFVIEPITDLVISSQANPIPVMTNTYIEIANSQLGVRYTLRDDATDSSVDVQIGDGGLISLNTGVLSDTTTFNVLAENELSTCSLELSQLITIDVDIPCATIDFPVSITPTDGICRENVEVAVAGSELYARYYLRDDANDTIIAGPVIGTGGPISFNFVAESSYTLNVVSCNFEMSDLPTLTIEPLSNLSISNDTVLCGNTGSVTVNNSQIGVRYYLKSLSNDNIITGPINGTGNDIVLSTNSLYENENFSVIGVKNDTNLAIQIDNANSQGVFAGNPTKLQLDSGTMELWFKTSNAGSGSRFLAGKIQAYAIYLINNELVISNSSNVINTGLILNDNAWHHIAFVFQSSVTNMSKLYVDGKLEKCFSFVNYYQFANFNIGTTGSKFSVYDGQVDEVRVWNTLRTQSEITSNMFARLNGLESGLTAYYPFEEGSGNTIYDQAPSPANGTLANPQSNPSDDWAPSTTVSNCSLELSQHAEFINVNPIEDLPITYNDTIVCKDIDSVAISSSQAGRKYYLRDNNNFILDGPIYGDGGTQYLVSDSIDSDRTYNLLAVAENGSSLAFDGVDDYVSCGNPSKYQIATGTVEAWVKTSNAGSGYRGIVTKQWAYGLFLANNQLIAYSWIHGEIPTGKFLNDNEWHHVALVFDNSSPAKIFLDGEEVQIIQMPIFINNQGTELQIGHANAANQNFQGQIDEVRIWTTPKSRQGIMANMFKPLSGNEPNLIGYYPIDKKCESMANDLASSSSHGILTNFTTSGWQEGCNSSAVGDTLQLTAPLNYVVVPISDQIISSEDDIILQGTSTNIIISNTQEGVKYILRDDLSDTPIDSLIGNGSQMMINTGNLSQTTTFNIHATKDVAGCNLEMTELVTVNVAKHEWIGAVNNDWSNPGNWAVNAVPTSADPVWISDQVNDPILDVDGEASFLWIDPSATLSLDNQNLSVTRDFYPNDAVVPQTGTVEFNGGQLQHLIGNGSWNNITLNNTGGLIIENGVNNVSGTLLLTSGLLTTNDSLTFTSTATKTGRIGEITGGDISGNVIFERYIALTGNDWRMIGSPLSNSTLNSWKDDTHTTGFPGAQFPNFNFTSLYSYDESVAGDKEQGWVSPTSINDAVNPGEGFYCYMGPSHVTLDVKGPINKGTISLPVSYYDDPSQPANQDGWNLLANPYPSAIDWDSPNWTKTNVIDAIYIWSKDVEQFTSYVGGVGTNGGSRHIASSQAFWIRTVGNSPELTAQESVKVNEDPNYIKSNPNILRLELTGQGSVDDIVLRFESGYTQQLEGNLDAPKFKSMNDEANIYFTNGSEDFSIQTIDPSELEISVPLQFESSTPGNYTIIPSELPELDSVSCLWLTDHLLDSVVDLRTLQGYSFTHSTSNTGIRFSINGSMGAQFDWKNLVCANDRQDITALGGGPGPWTYTWTDLSNNIIITDTHHEQDTLNQVTSGNYVIQISSSVGCGNSYDTLNIEETSDIVIIPSIQNVVSGSDGSIDLQIIGGTPPYSFIWRHNATITNHAAIQDLSTGKYYVLVTDSLGCSSEMEMEIEIDETSSIKELISPELTIYPNPAADLINVTSGFEGYDYYIINNIGQTIISGVINDTPINIEQLSNGIYNFRVVSNEESITNQFQVIK